MWLPVYAAFNSLKLLLLQAWMLLLDCGGGREGAWPQAHPLTFHTPTQTHSTSFSSFCFFILHHLLLLLSTSGSSLLLSLPYLSLLLISSWCREERRGVIKEPDWSVNSAQSCMSAPDQAMALIGLHTVNNTHTWAAAGPREKLEKATVHKLALIKKGSLSTKM